MPKRKPAGWPKYMVSKRLAAGSFAYYWAMPTWAKKGGCTIGSIALGGDYGDAKARCDEVINPQFDAWRSKGASPADPVSNHGTFDWMVGVYKRSPQYKKLKPGTRADYDRALQDVSQLPLKDGKRRIGEMNLKSITPGGADKLYDRLKVKANGEARERSAKASIVCCKLAWNTAWRSEPKAISSINPFKGVKMDYAAEATRPVTHDELLRFVAAADAEGEASIGTAAMLAFYWLQRQTDILNRLSWGHYKPDGKPIAKIWHHKTGAEVDLPLFDDAGLPLWPELMERLDGLERRGTLIVMRDNEDRTKKTFLPWKEDYFRHRVADIRAAAEIDPDVKFMGLRHGGNTEGADADLSDAQLRALSGHKSTAMVHLYAKATMKQRREGARKRRDARAEGGSGEK
jgi:hypothetical protein